jgi:hypothetical protein
MLSREENDLITRVGPGTPMGELMRCYWIPALLSQEVPEPDCPPVRVRLLGEDLVAFRDSQGRVGLLDKGNPEGYTIHSHVPMDDEHALRFNIFFRRNRPVNLEEKQLEGGIGPDHIKVRNIDNNYLQDREEQKHETFTGMGRQFLIHDSCATESMGPIYDRSKEHLGAGDITVIAVRKFLLQSVRALDRGKEPPHVIRTPEQNDLRHLACIVRKIDARLDPKRYIEELLAGQKLSTNV